MGHLTKGPIDVAALSAGLAGASDGGLATFVGMVRDHHQGRSVVALEYEAHESLAETMIDRLVSQAGQRWEVGAAVVAHRLGLLQVGEVAVAVLVAAPHREAALEACRWLIDTLKAEVPIFKKEHYAGSNGASAWVGDETPA